MQKFIRTLFVSAAIVLGSAACTGVSAQSTVVFPDVSNDPLYSTDTNQALHDILIDVSWNQKPMRQVLRDLSLVVRTARPIGGDIDFRMSSTAPPEARERLVSLQLRRTNVYEILSQLSAQAHFTIRVHPALVLIMPR